MATATFYGYNPPFMGGLQNVLSRQEDIRLIQNDILQLLLTIPGERVMRPTFGVHLRNFVFEMLSNPDLSALQNEIKDALAREEKRVTVEYVTINADSDDNRIRIFIQSRLKRDPSQEVNVETFLRTNNG